MTSGTRELDVFVKESLRVGASRNDIEKAAVAAGWPSDQAKNALGAYADISFPVPVPKPRPSMSAREAFLYLVMFSTLYTSAFHLGDLLFDFINRAFPDPAASDYSYRGNFWDSMRWSVSSLIIAFPIFLFTARYIGRELVLNPIKRLSPVRRWLTYITLFIALSILIGDMTALVYNVLGGELTARFLLKVIVVAVIAGTIFWYYLSDLRREEKES
ncbi:MAG: DUF5671 domain-containing protein [Alphaproteobacteria bacterium]|nr:DUF5671 domain-containing protein [Alphaproteobacteria bacterium]